VESDDALSNILISKPCGIVVEIILSSNLLRQSER
jgi:hypothetical protein